MKAKHFPSILFAIAIVAIAAYLLEIETQLSSHESISSLLGFDTTQYSFIKAFIILSFSSFFLSYPFIKEFKKSKETQDLLRDETLKIKQAVIDLDAVIIITDALFNVMEINDQTKVLCQLSRSSCLNRKAQDLPLFTKKNQIIDALQQAKEHGRSKFHQKILDQKKNPLFFDFAVRELRSNNKYDVGYVLLGNNISKAKSAEEKALKSQQELSSIIDNSPIAIIEMDKKSVVRMWNDAAEDMFSLPQSKILNKASARSLFLDQGEFLNIWKKCLKLKGNVTQRCSNKKGKDIIFCDWHMSQNLDANGEITGIVALVQDITDQVQYYNQIRDNEERALLVKDITHKVVSGNGIDNIIDDAIEEISLFHPFSCVHVYVRYNPSDESFSSLKSWSKYEENNFPDFIEETNNLILNEDHPYINILNNSNGTWTSPENPEIIKLRTKTHYFKSALFYPIFAWGKVAAILEFFDFDNRKKPNELIDILDNISSQISLSLEKNASELERERYLFKLDQKVKVSEFLYSSLNLLFSTDYDTDDLMPVLVNMILATMENSHETGIKINLKDKVFEAGEGSILINEFNLNIENEQIGSLEVFTSNRDHQLIEDEEENLLNSICKQISTYISRKAHQEALSIAKDQAESANRSKSDFLATMSHEIRTPMNGIVGMIDLLRHTEINQEQEEMISTVKDSTYSLLQIINDILDFSKIEAGKMTLENIEFDIYDVIEGVNDVLAVNASKKDVKLFCKISNDVPQYLIGDPVRIRQIILNLLGNAIKFTTTVKDKIGTVFISVEIDTPVGNDGTLPVRINVKDTGIGMKQNAVDNLFKPFMQADSATTRKFGGTGLGLSICYHLVKLMAGNISVKSEVGVGSTFSVNLNLPMSKRENNYLNPPQLDNLSFQCYFDLPEQIEVFKHYITYTGAKVRIQQELVMPNKQHYCHLIANTWPLHERIEHGKNIKEFDSDAKIIVLINSDELSKVNDDTNGLTYLRVNPMRKTKFFQVISKVQIDEKAKITEKIVTDNPFSGRILVAEDHKTNQKVISRQLDLLQYEYEIADDGQIALQMWQRGEHEIILTDMHMPNMDGLELTAAVRKIEEGTGHRTPVIAITANAMKGEEEKYLEQGLDDYLAKPTELGKLKEKLTYWSNKLLEEEQTELIESFKESGIDPTPRTATFELNDEPFDLDGDSFDTEEDVDEEVPELTNNVSFDIDNSEPEPEPEPEPPEDSDEYKPTGEIDLNALGSFVGDDLEIQQEVLKEFPQPTLDTLQELKVALADDDVKQAGEVGHKMKSAARVIGANDLADLCFEVEKLGKDGDSNTLTEIESKTIFIESEVNAVVKTIEEFLAS